jgi:hypothetical protein
MTGDPANNSARIYFRAAVQVFCRLSRTVSLGGKYMRGVIRRLPAPSDH